MLLLAFGCASPDVPVALSIQVLEDPNLLSDGPRRWPWTLTLVAERVEGSPDTEENCPESKLGVATLNGQISSEWEPGIWVESRGILTSSYCAASTAVWRLDSLPDAAELELGELGSYTLDLPLIRVERLEPALDSVGRDEPIRFSVTPPLEEGAELSTFGHSLYREPFPFLGCWSEAWVDGGDVVGTADLGEVPSVGGFDRGACALGLSILRPPAELSPCGAASCSLVSELKHIEALSLEGF